MYHWSHPRRGYRFMNINFLKAIITIRWIFYRLEFPILLVYCFFYTSMMNKHPLSLRWFHNTQSSSIMLNPFNIYYSYVIKSCRVSTQTICTWYFMTWFILYEIRYLFSQCSKMKKKVKGHLALLRETLYKPFISSTLLIPPLFLL